jgi:hypothetical protein
MVVTRRKSSASTTSASDSSNKGKEKQSTTSSTAKEDKEKARILLKHTCYVCGNTYSGAQQTIRHVKDIHGFDMPSRPIGKNRPSSEEYEYIKKKDDNGQVLPEEHYACPSCWYHCPDYDLKALYKHTQDEYDPIDLNPTTGAKENDDDDSDDNNNNSSNSPTFSGKKSGNVNDSTRREITRKLEEVTDLFKSFFKY